MLIEVFNDNNVDVRDNKCGNGASVHVVTIDGQRKDSCLVIFVLLRILLINRLAMASLFENLTELKAIVEEQASKTIEINVSGKRKRNLVNSDSIKLPGEADYNFVVLPQESSPPVPRNKIKVAVCSAQVSDEILFEEAADANKKLYLPRYRLVEETVSGQRRYRLSLESFGQGWNLIVYLEAYPAPKIETQISNAQIIAHEARISLKYKWQGQQNQWEFQEVIKEEGGQKLKAVLQLYSLEERDKAYLALTDSAYNAVLVVKRLFRAATPVNRPSESLATIVSSGAATIRGTWSFNFDTGVEGGNGDVWWQQKTDVDRSMVPRGKAQIINLGVVNFNLVSAAQLQNLNYSTMPIEGSNNASNQLMNGDVFAVRTNSGNYAKAKILEYGYNLKIQWETYPSAAPVSASYALQFDGANSYVECADNPSLNVVTQHLTMEAWVKLDDANNDQKIFGKSSIGNGYVLGVVHNQLYAEIWDNRGQRYAVFLGRLATNEWVHLAVTWTTGGQMIGYINGIEVGRINASANPIGRANGTLKIGAAPWNVSQWQTKGLIKEVRLWNVARNQGQIFGDMHRQIAGNEPGLVGYWVGNEGAGDRVLDKTANNNLGLLRGNVKWASVPPLIFYSEANYILSDIVDDSFFFPPLLYEYIFRNVKPIVGVGSNLIQRQVEWNGNWYNYYQDATERYRFYYLPDSFQIGKRRDSGQPTISLQFQFLDSSQQTLSKLEYYAPPVVNTERLKAAATKLLRFAQPLPEGVDSLEFPPLKTPKNLQFRLSLPGENGSLDVLQNRNARLNLQVGIFDTLTLAVPEEFQAVWDAMFSTRQEKTLFTGQVVVEIEGGYLEEIPFQVRLQDNPDTLWNAIFQADVPAQYVKSIEVKTFKEMFNPPALRPQDSIISILVDFERSETVELTAKQLNATAKLTLPIKDIVLRQADAGVYRYKLEVIRQSRKQTYDWQETTMEILYPDVEV